MAATAAQIDANRTNSEASTGPITEAGKSRSSQNALRHGLACGRLIIEGENPEELKKLRSDLRQEHRPSGLTEDLLVEKMAVALWFSRRAKIYQSAAFDAAPEGVPVPEKLAVLLRFQTTNDRAFYKALQTLRDLQKERRKTETAAQIGFVQKATPEQL
ncbi:MAG: hypothetical protein JWO80_2853, partial [Bryobacterales bacterium]|nr:hypothetical protein [Bryobacterales bacterium]